tara:strand:- start:877 stop:1266 length:390 start_codon:yes stop_codon:yes gene_type:complete
MTKQDMIKNYRQAVKAGAFVSTDSIALLSAVKREKFEKAVSHFADKESLITQLIQLSVKLEATKHFMSLLQYYKTGKIQKRPYLTTFTKDKDFQNVLIMFLGDNYTRDDIIILYTMVEDALLSSYCQLM